MPIQDLNQQNDAVNPVTQQAPNLPNQQAQPAQNQGAQQNQQNTPNEKEKNTFTFSDQNTVFGLGVDVINDGLMKLEKSINEVITSRISNAKVEIGLIPLDHRNYRDLPLDVMLVTAKRREEDIVAVYAIGIANSSDVLLTAQSDEINGRRYTLDVYPSLVFNDQSMTRVFMERAKEKFPEKALTYAGGSVLHADQTDFADADVVLKVLLNAVAADITATLMEKSRQVGQVIDLNFGKHDSTEELVCERKILNGVVLNEYGHPIRADFMFSINANNISNAKENRFAVQNMVKEITSITGYIDVLPVSPRNHSGDSPWSNASPWNRVQHQDPNGQPSRQMYATNIVLTSLNPARYQTIGNMVWSLACAVSAAWDGYWWVRQGLNPSNQPEQTNIHSVAGLGYEISAMHRLPEFQPLVVSGPDFNDQVWGDYIQEYFTPNFLFSLEVAEASPSQWRYDPFIAAAYEEESVRSRPTSWNNRILSHTDTLCNGKFLPIYRELNGSGRVMRMLRERMHVVGQYHNPVTKSIRSLQDFDRRFLLNLVNGKQEQMDLVRDWTYAQVDETLKTEQRIGIQQDIIRQVAPHAKVFGYGTRLDFDEVYIQALVRAIGDAGMVLVNNNVVQPVGQFHYANYISNSMMDNLSRSIMTHGTTRQNNAAGLFGFGSARRY